MLDTIKGYIVEEQVGSGGFGVVYRARQSSTFDRDVAIKVIQPRYANQPDFIRRFESEAQLVARLEHPFIVPLYDYWREPDSAYLVMRRLSGGNIHDALKSGPLDVKFSLNVLQQVALALTTAHQQGVIHRDVKPSNILLDTHGNAYLADFGIAKDLMYFQPNTTHPDAIIGSPGYMAPEQARREVLSPRTDVYSLGVTLYEMLAGEHPFKDANTVEKLYKHLNDALPLLENLEPSIADAVNEVIQKATCKNPMDRFADPLEMVAAFRAAIQFSEDEPENIVAILTRREQEILQMVVEGKSNKEIAAALFVTVSTVRTHLRQAYKKLNVRTRMQAIVRVRELNLVVNGDETVVGEYGSSAYIMLPEATNPYKGLNAFTAADSKDFFGRAIQRLLHRMQDDVENRRFLAIVGPSGQRKIESGQSRISAIWRGEVKGSDDWYTIDLIPGAHPIDELEVALQRVVNAVNDNIHDHLMRDARGLVRVGQLILPEDDSELLIVVDQFEEVFTLVEDEAQRGHFLDLIETAVTDPRSRVRIVITLRADFYDRPLQYPQFGELLRNRMETILPLSAEELEASIVQPAKAVGVKYADGVVASIIADVNYQPGALPLLQYALTELFDCHEKRLITRQHYQDIGGTVGAIAQRADTLFEEFDEAGQQLARQLFLRLVTLGEGTEDTRRRVELRELLALTEQSDLAYEIIDAYAAYRLLSLDHDPATRQPTVEVAHEAILREWERLRKWLNESRDDIKTQRQIATLATAWKENCQDEAYLVRGSRLEGFQLWSLSTELSLTPTEMDYLSASIEAQERREAEKLAQIEREARLENRARKVLQGLVAVFLMAAVVAIGLALFALGERSTAQEERNRAETERDNAQSARQEAEHERDTETSRRLAAQAEDELDGANPETGVLLALEVLENYPFTQQAKAALIRGVEDYRAVRVLVGIDSIGDSIFIGKWSPDGTRIAAGGNGIEGVSVIIWDVATGAELLAVAEGEERCSSRVDELTWSPSGDRIASLSNATGCGVAIWDTTDGETLLVLLDYENRITSVDWSPDETTLVTGHVDGTITLWDASTGDVDAMLIGHDAQVNDVIWSPDGDLIASASSDSTVRLWEPENGIQTAILVGHVGAVWAVTWSPDNTRVVTGGDDGLLRIWDVSSGDAMVGLRGHGGRVLSIDWSQDGYRIASTSPQDAVTKVWDAASGTFLFEIQGVTRKFGYFSPNNDQLITASWSIYGRVNVWDVSLSASSLIGATNENVYYADWSPDGRLIASISENNARLWDAATGQQMNVVEFLFGANEFGDWSPDSTRLAIPFAPFPGTNDSPHIIIWDVVNGETTDLPVPDHLSPITADWSSDGAYIASGLYNPDGLRPVYVWDVETLELLWVFEPDDDCMQGFIEFSPDSSKILAACFWFDEENRNRSARIWDVETGELISTMEGRHGSIHHAVWSPDGERILAAYQGVAEIWDAESGEVLLTFAGHGIARIDGADWHPDGTYVVTGDSSGTVKVWHSETGEEVASYTVDGQVQNTQWSPDGTHIIIGGLGITEPIIKRVWTSTDDLIDYAYDCCITRELTPEEREQFGLPSIEE